MKITCRFYEELNDFLPQHRRKRDFEVEFVDRRSVKDLIESLGAPHTEIDLILVNGESVDFSHVVDDGERISVYPVFESLDVAGVTHLSGRPLRRTRFIADAHLGDLARTLRLLGLDVRFDPGLSPGEILDCAAGEGRVILTRSRKLLKHKRVTHGIFVYPGAREEQAARILDSLNLRDAIRPFSRCLCCNRPLRSVEKEEVLDRIPHKVKEARNEFALCPSCDRVYWKGTHYLKMKGVLDRIFERADVEKGAP
ncbi:MAG: Mut7-C ubiquitin/RNAse domain-containing protein [Deltaproteobacteria bacterium]|nr:Mut7-C ubiquitin/RNAse domain-containing protein [Deltaproteobacteria bacterium]